MSLPPRFPEACSLGDGDWPFPAVAVEGREATSFGRRRRALERPPGVVRGLAGCCTCFLLLDAFTVVLLCELVVEGSGVDEPTAFSAAPTADFGVPNRGEEAGASLALWPSRSSSISKRLAASAGTCAETRTSYTADCRNTISSSWKTREKISNPRSDCDPDHRMKLSARSNKTKTKQTMIFSVHCKRTLQAHRIHNS